jgi:hypothetical protein
LVFIPYGKAKRYLIFVFQQALNTGRLKKLTESYVVSNSKIKQALGIEKMPVTANEGFKMTFESFQGII